jgi:ABC-2 type transport system permease protein
MPQSPAVFAFFLGLVVLQATLAFWTVESLEVANTLTYGGVYAAQYPIEIYSKWLREFFTFVVPLSCVAYFPIVGILGIDDPLGAPRWFLSRGSNSRAFCFSLPL